MTLTMTTQGHDPRWVNPLDVGISCVEWFVHHYSHGVSIACNTLLSWGMIALSWVLSHVSDRIDTPNLTSVCVDTQWMMTSGP